MKFLFLIFCLFSLSGCLSSGTGQVEGQKGTSEGVAGVKDPVGRPRFLNAKGRLLFFRFNQQFCQWEDAINEYEPGRFKRLGNLETTEPIVEIDGVTLSRNGNLAVDGSGKTYQFVNGLACLDPTIPQITQNRFIDYWCGLELNQNGVTSMGDVYFYRFGNGEQRGAFSHFIAKAEENSIFGTAPIVNGNPLWNDVYWRYPSPPMVSADPGIRRLILKSDAFAPIAALSDPQTYAQLTEEEKTFFPPGRDSIIYIEVDIDISNPGVAYERENGRFPARLRNYSGLKYEDQSPDSVGWCRLAEWIQ